jgi:chaperone required for assembly of F1-ATPase
MREIFDQISSEQGADPTEAARRAMRPVLRKRFYDNATAGAKTGEGFPVLLDGRPVRTPARRPLATPSRPLTEAIAAEWQALDDLINPAAMPLTRLANSIIDGLGPEAPDAAREAVAAEVAKYLASDLLFYRAGEPQGLVARQEALWDPVLAWAHRRFGAQFILSQGVVFAAQPERTLAAARAEIPADPWRLGAVHAITTLTGSALLALALLHDALSAEEAWAAAHVDEDWNMQTWGRDELALKRRAYRWAEMQAAATVLRLLAEASAT